MLTNAYLVLFTWTGADTAENEQHFDENLSSVAPETPFALDGRDSRGFAVPTRGVVPDGSSSSRRNSGALSLVELAVRRT